MESDTSRLEKRLSRERKARLDAEAIAEWVTRELYEKQRQLSLLQAVSVAANQAVTSAAAIQFALDEICSFSGWPVGHAYVAARPGARVMVPTSLWHLEPPVERFAELRRVTEATHMPAGVCLPGRVLSGGTPVWIVDVRTDQNFPRVRAAADLGVRAAFAFPVNVQREVAAVLEFFSDRPAEPDETLLALMAHIGAQLGRVIERQWAEERLQQSELRYRAVSELTSDYGYAFRIEPNGAVVTEWFAGPVERITGYTSQELESMGGGFHIVHPEDAPSALQRVQRLVLGEPDVSEFRIVTKSGETRWLRESGRPVLGVDGRVVRIFCAAQDVTERKRAEGNTRSLLELAKDISGSLDLGDLLQCVVRRTLEMLSCDGVAIFYWDGQRQVFRLAAHQGILPERVAAAEALAFSPGMPFGGRIANGEMVVINDMSKQTFLPCEAYAPFSIKSVVAVPLRAAERHLGAMVVWSGSRCGAFDQAQLDLCAGIAQQLSVAAGAAELYREQQEQAQVASAIARLGQTLMSRRHSPELLGELCRFTTEELACDCSHTFLLEPDKDVFTFVSGYGDTGEQTEALSVLEVPQTIVANLVATLDREGVAQAVMSQPQDLIPAGLSTRYGISTAMYVPLRRDGKVVGIHTACYRGRDERFSPIQERIAAGMSEIGSLALENARLVEQLERADRLKSEFMATMSHELRTPLNIIMGYVDLLLDEMFGPLAAAQQDTLQRTQRSARQLLDLVEATLDISRLESGRLAPKMENVHLPELIGDIERTTQELVSKPGVAITWPPATDLPTIRTDPLKLKIILRNLIDNAVKFTEKGDVTVSATPVSDGVEFAVRDTGIGIDPEALPIIFEPFRQVDGSDSRRFPGAGLGLYTVRLMVQALGGTVEVESAEARGSCFLVRIPDAGSATEERRRIETPKILGEWLFSGGHI